MKGTTLPVTIADVAKRIEYTAPWDQPRNATTVTFRRPDWQTAGAFQLQEQLEAENPDMLDPVIEHVHSPRNQGVCCLISWRNPAVCWDCRLPRRDEIHASCTCQIDVTGCTHHQFVTAEMAARRA